MHVFCTPRRSCLAVAWLFVLTPIVQSDPLAHPGELSPLRRIIPTISNPQTGRTPTFTPPDSSNGQCPLQFEADISHSVAGHGGHGIRTAPLLHSMMKHAGGEKQVLVSTLSEHLEMLSFQQQHQQQAMQAVSEHYAYEEDSGHIIPPEFPLLFESSLFLGSPVVYDVDGDGQEEAILVDYDARIHIVHLHHDDHQQNDQKEKRRGGAGRGYVMARLPKLLLRKDWFNYEEQQKEQQSMKAEERTGVLNKNKNKDKQNPFHSYFKYQSDHHYLYHAHEDHPHHDHHHDHQDGQHHDHDHFHGIAADPLHLHHDTVSSVKEKRQQQQQQFQSEQSTFAAEARPRRRLQEVSRNSNPDDYLDDDVAFWGDSSDSSDSSDDNDDDDNDDANDYYDMQDDDDYTPDDDDAAWMGYDDDDVADYYNYDDDFDDDFHDVPNKQKNKKKEEDFVALHPHLLCTPTVAEFQYRQQGVYSNAAPQNNAYLVMAVSYYLDNHDKQDKNDTIRADNYVASAILTYNLHLDMWGQAIHLDLSTDHVFPMRDEFDGKRAFAFASPTVADVNNDGRMEIIVPTSMGYIFVLDSTYGDGLLWRKRMEGEESGGYFPILQMPGEVRGPVAVVDVVKQKNQVSSDSRKGLDLFVGDMEGNLVCLDGETGNTKWHRNLNGGGIASTVSFGDIDGDGTLEVVVLARVGDAMEIWVLDATTGKNVALDHFPMSLRFDPKKQNQRKDTEPEDEWVAPRALLVDLHADQSYWMDQFRGRKNTSSTNKKGGTPQHGGHGQGLHIVFPSPNGRVYIVEGATGCTNYIEMNDKITMTSGSGMMVLAHDVTGTGVLSLVVGTENGEVVALHVPSVKMHPFNAKASSSLSTIGGSGSGAGGGFVQGYSARTGLLVQEPSASFREILGMEIPVTFEILDKDYVDDGSKTLYIVDIRDGSSSKRSVFYKVYDKPGVYTERIVPANAATPRYLSLVVSMTTHDFGLRHEQMITVGYNVHYYQGLQWLAVLPLILATIPLVFFMKKEFEPRGLREGGGGRVGDMDDYRRNRNEGLLGRTNSFSLQ